jgi:hypothetical protein
MKIYGNSRTQFFEAKPFENHHRFVLDPFAAFLEPFALLHSGVEGLFAQTHRVLYHFIAPST